MPLKNDIAALVDAGRALEKMVATLRTKKLTASTKDRNATRKSFRDAAHFLRRAGYSKPERDEILKPYQLGYDPNHRTR
jgi:hypothetical protein